MRRPALPTFRWLVAALALLVSLAPAMALDKKKDGDLASKEFFRPELYISSNNVAMEQGLTQVRNRQAWQQFLAEQGNDVQVHFDPRSGNPSSILLHVPLIPGQGVGNQVTMGDLSESFAQTIAGVDTQVVARAVVRFVEQNQAILGVDVNQMGAARGGQANTYLWQIAIPQVVNGIPVRYARILASVNHGNLILLGTDNWANVQIDTNPAFSADDAVQIGSAYFGRQPQDKIWRDPALEIIPFAPPEQQEGEGFAGPMGAGYGHKLVWTFGIIRPDQGAAYEMMVDAHTGELLAMEDTNHYIASQVTGGIYPLTNTGICPSNDRCGIMQPGSPMPHANTGFAPPNDFTNSAGLYDYTAGTLTTTLNGKFVRITDTCGAISESSATGVLDLGGTNGQHDCTTAGTSAGDTASSRSAFYEVGKLKEQARGWIPANAWLNAIQQTNVNIAQTCNAFYSPGAGTINFYRSGGGCGNTGEIAAVFDHEWGHAFDDNDTVGTLSSSSETYADIAAAYRLQAQCIGYGFWATADQGCGPTSDGTGFNGDNGQTGVPECLVDCSGVRGIDWGLTAEGTPNTPANFVCTKCLTGSGPCGRQVHCDAIPASESAWDFAARDLQAAPYNYDNNMAFIVANKTYYQGSGSIGSWATCTCPATSNGCGATNAYLQWLTADDDNGNVNDGTPHMTALFNAFDRHGIACAAPAVADSGCAGGPTTATTVSLAAGSNQITLNWTAVAGATAYWVMRTEGFAGCNFGKARIATVAGLTYSDNDVANGRPYSYVVVPQGATEACYAPASACITGTPQPCAGSISLNKPTYNCTDSMNITLVDSDLTGAMMQNVTIFSGTEPTPETLSLTETPANSGIFTGTFNTTNAPPMGGDNAVSVANGDTITVRYHDASFCGPAQDVDRTANVDCVGPVITNVQSNQVTGNTAHVLWDTDEPADSTVVYDTMSPPSANMTSRPQFVTSHDVTLTGLSACTPYFYYVSSSDPSGNSATDDNGMSFYTFQTGQNVTPTYTYGGPPVPIPEFNPLGARATINVPDNKTVQDINVTVSSLTHSFDGDLELSLEHDTSGDGTIQATERILMVNNRGGGGDNFTNTTLDDEAATAVSSGAAPFTGTFRPDTAFANLENINALGDWTLFVADLANIDTGTIIGWSINFTYPTQACGPSVEYVSSTTTESCSIGGPGSGNGTIEPGEEVIFSVVARNNGTANMTNITGLVQALTPGVTVTDDTASFPDLAPDASGMSAAPHFKFVVGSSVPCGTTLNFKITFMTDQGAFVSTFGGYLVGAPGAPIPTTISSTDVPKVIADLATVTSTLNVAGLSTVQDVNLTVGSITHTFTGDLVLTLMAPNATNVILANRRGGGGDNFTNTVFDDEAATPVSSGTAPYSGSFRPEGSLATLDGIDPNGTWTLIVQDAAGIDTGTLLAWSITISTPGAPICNVCAAQPAPGEVTGVIFTPGTKDTMEWNATPDATYYNVYRGIPSDLPHLLDAMDDSCLRATTATTTTGATLNAPGDLASGSFRWYIVRAGNAGGEGPPGNATAGPRVHNSSGSCP